MGRVPTSSLGRCQLAGAGPPATQGRGVGRGRRGSRCHLLTARGPDPPRLRPAGRHRLPTLTPAPGPPHSGPSCPAHGTARRWAPAPHTLPPGDGGGEPRGWPGRLRTRPPCGCIQRLARARLRRALPPRPPVPPIAPLRCITLRNGIPGGDPRRCTQKGGKRGKKQQCPRGAPRNAASYKDPFLDSFQLSPGRMRPPPYFRHHLSLGGGPAPVRPLTQRTAPSRSLSPPTKSRPQPRTDKDQRLGPGTRRASSAASTAASPRPADGPAPLPPSEAERSRGLPAKRRHQLKWLMPPLQPPRRSCVFA